MKTGKREDGITGFGDGRDSLTRAALIGAASTGLPAGLRAEGGAGLRVGLGAYSCGLTWKAIREGQPATKFRDTLSFLEYAHSLGAAGIQAVLPPAEQADAGRLRARVEELGAYFEGELRLPREEADLPRVEADLRAASQAGATVVRTAVLGTRRYETFKQPADLGVFIQSATRSLELVRPLLEKHGLRLAIENHKDFLVPELLELLGRFGGEWIGVCVDIGNSLALLENPDAVVEALAPHAFTVHLKDMAVQEYEQGFLLSEVPLGAGFLDLPRLVSALLRANPRLALNLEMITRDPLKIPCLTPEYWITLGELKAAQLAEAVARVKRNPPHQPLPRITGLDAAAQLALEEEHNRRSLAYAGDSLAASVSSRGGK